MTQRIVQPFRVFCEEMKHSWNGPEAYQMGGGNHTGPLEQTAYIVRENICAYLRIADRKLVRNHHNMSYPSRNRRILVPAPESPRRRFVVVAPPVNNIIPSPTRRSNPRMQHGRKRRRVQMDQSSGTELPGVDIPQGIPQNSQDDISHYGTDVEGIGEFDPVDISLDSDMISDEDESVMAEEYENAIFAEAVDFVRIDKRTWIAQDYDCDKEKPMVSES